MSNSKNLGGKKCLFCLIITFQEECRDIIDKYIEYDPVVISLDILLLNRKALRHVLFNSQIKGYWKYVILLLVCDSFVKMTLQRAKGEITPVNPTYIIYSAMEWGLYKNFLLAAVELTSLILFISFLVLMLSMMPTVSSDRRTGVNKHKQSWRDMTDVMRAVILSNFGKFLVILAVLWGTQNSDIYIHLIKTYICAANVQALRVCLPSRSIWFVMAVTLAGHFLSMTVTHSIQVILFGS